MDKHLEVRHITVCRLHRLIEYTETSTKALQHTLPQSRCSECPVLGDQIRSQGSAYRHVFRSGRNEG